MAYLKIVRKLKPQEEAFDPAARPANDADRVKALRKYKITDSPSEEIFSLYTELAARTFGTPIALISFVDDDTVFYKEAYGVNRTGETVKRRNSPCTLAIMNDHVTLLRYALSDPCVLADSKNLEEAGYKFYAGAPLTTPDHYNIGMLAVVDKAPRNYSDDELGKLKDLADEVMREVELRHASNDPHEIKELNTRINALRARVDELKGIAGQ